MNRSGERGDLPDAGRIRLLEGDVDKMEQALVDHTQRVEQSLKAVSGQLGKVLWALLGLCITIISTLATALIVARSK
jgi:hypothetical protein